MARLHPPEDGAVVRMYRQGHGDCFLLAFPRAGGGEPVYVLIDCGYKPGSQKLVHGKTSGDIAKHIGTATGKKIDLMLVTHEHQDHVNAIWRKRKPYFQPLDIEEAWLAWTEDPADELAETLRRRHRDQILALVEARRRLALAVGKDDRSVQRLDGLLGFELGGESEQPTFSASDIEASVNKQALKLVKDKAAARRGVRYLSPGGAPLEVPGTDGVRAYILGPPRSEDLLADEDPVGREGFPTDPSHAHGLSFRAAVSEGDGSADAPFAGRYRVPLEAALEHDFFRSHYGKGDDPPSVADKSEVASNAAWRRIDDDWLHSAEGLALKLNRGINNTSLVVAFELPRSRKILLFVGDAQRGNWISWKDHTWKVGRETVTARDLLARTVLYKVGHHGSHNATLAGNEGDDYPNLAWMARNVPNDEFCAMVTAVREWAMSKSPPWNHPLPSISAALGAKAAGRVLQTDTDQPVKPDTVSAAAWKRFTDRLTISDFCFDLIFRDL